MKAYGKTIIYTALFFVLYIGLGTGGVFLESYLKAQYITDIFVYGYDIVATVILAMIFGLLFFSLEKKDATVKSYGVIANVFLIPLVLTFLFLAFGSLGIGLSLFAVFQRYCLLSLAFAILLFGKAIATARYAKENE